MAPPAQVESPAEERHREDGRGEDLQPLVVEAEREAMAEAMAEAVAVAEAKVGVQASGPSAARRRRRCPTLTITLTPHLTLTLTLTTTPTPTLTLTLTLTRHAARIIFGLFNTLALAAAAVVLGFATWLLEWQLSALLPELLVTGALVLG